MSFSTPKIRYKKLGKKRKKILQGMMMFNGCTFEDKAKERFWVFFVWCDNNRILCSTGYLKWRSMTSLSCLSRQMQMQYFSDVLLHHTASHLTKCLNALFESSRGLCTYSCWWVKSATACAYSYVYDVLHSCCHVCVF